MMNIYEKFAQKTTIHGVSDIQNTGSVKWRCFWIVILISCTVGAGFEIYRIFDQFNKKPLLTTYETRSLKDVDFPELTICVPNIINSSKVAQLKISTTVINNLVASTPMISAGVLYAEPILDGLHFPMGETMPVMIQPNRSQALEAAKSLSTTLGVDPSIIMNQAEIELQKLFSAPTQHTDLFSLHFEMVKKYLNIDNTLNYVLLLDDVAMDLTQLFQVCVVDSLRDCNSIVRTVPDALYRRCFHAKSQGPSMVVLFLINLHNDVAWKSLPFMYEGIGIYIADKYTPYPDSNVNIPSGSSVQLQLSPVHYSMKKGRKYGWCRDEIEFKVLDVNYSYVACLTDCSYYVSYELCGCMLMVPSTFTKKQNITFCKSPEELLCATGVVQHKQYNDCQLLCKARCDYWQYNPSLWFMKFPSAPFREWFREHGKDVKHLENFISLSVSYTQQTYTLVSQEEALTIDGFISQIGGQVGLFLGASIISVIQLATFFIKPVFSRRKLKSEENNVV